ncbi:MAG: hypothetical protein IJJ41_03600 [Clostridia bacterium]|nr:hypothetical protein [Clostridia bacterium]
MKKTIAIIVSLLLIVSMIPMAASASEKTDEIKARIEAARDFLYGEKTEFTADESYDFMLYLDAGGDGAKYKDAYVQSVKDAFDAGKMTTADKIALAGLCLEELGVETIPFELNDGSTVDLRDKMVELGVSVDSPYNYLYIQFFASNEDYLQQVQDALKANYTAGKGYDYYGFGTDNTANFAAMINEKALKDDAAAVVEKAKVDKGYYYLEEYGTDANGNSTASVLYMYARLCDLDYNGNDTTDADAAYKLLTENFALENGAFSYELGGEANNYATRDALKAMIYYLSACEAAEMSEDTTEPASEETTAPATGTDNAVTETTAPATQSDNAQSTPATGDSFVACGIAGAAMLALGVTLALRKKEEK